MYSSRIDYVKVAKKLDHDVAQQLGKIWYDTFEGKDGTGENARSAHVNSVRKEADGKYLWIFEAWGVASGAVVNLDWDMWAKDLVRMDVRGEQDVTKGGVDRVYQHLSHNKKGARNIQLFSSKVRSKRSGRDTGGYGIAIGSHKSDVRITIYVRGNAAGAMEFQFSGKKLAQLIQIENSLKAVYMVDSNADYWIHLMQSIAMHGELELENISGLTRVDLADVIADNAPLETEVELVLQQVDALMDNLSPDALRGVLVSIQQRLFE